MRPNITRSDARKNILMWNKTMKRFLITFTIMLIVAVTACTLVACDNNDNGGGNNPTPGPSIEHVDYVSQLKLDLNSETAKVIDPKIHMYIDGDTTHFTVSNSVIPGGVLKARYLAIDTPESTGRIEPYGKKASKFTKEKLSTATSIVIEADGDTWKADSTGSRYMTWVWYKPSKDADYRNLNVEILQNGLAIASNTAQNRYGNTAMAALNQAKAEKLNVFSGKDDPDFYKGDVIEITLKELRCNPTEYDGKKVAVEGVVSSNSGANSVYLESVQPDPETGLRYGVTCYYAYKAVKLLDIGNYVRVVGTFAVFEGTGAYQISNIVEYDEFDDENENQNVTKLLDNNKHTPAYTPIDAGKFANQEEIEIEFEKDDEITTKSYSYPELILSTSVSLNSLKVVSIYTTKNEASSQKGAMTLTCKTQDGYTITIRTAVLMQNGQMVTESAFRNKTIDVKGIVDCYNKATDDSYENNPYQIRVFSMDDIVIY